MPERNISTRAPIIRSAPNATESPRLLPVRGDSGARIPIVRAMRGSQVVTNARDYEAPIRNGLTPEELNQAILNNPPLLPGSSNLPNAVSPTQPAGTFYGDDDPFAVLSDVFRNVFGSDGDTGRATQTGQALVPVTSTSGGSNSIVILIVIIVIAGGGYYLYKKNA